MITRRELVKWGVAGSALAGSSFPAFARASSQHIDIFVSDRRYPSVRWEGVKTYEINGDVTALWYDVIGPAWKRPGFIVSGITGEDALFVLEMLAFQHGRRVVTRKPLPSPHTTLGAVSWVIAPVHPLMKR